MNEMDFETHIENDGRVPEITIRMTRETSKLSNDTHLSFCMQETHPLVEMSKERCFPDIIIFTMSSIAAAGIFLYPNYEMFLFFFESFVRLTELLDQQTSECISW
jgi:hypothetical protein